MTRYEKGFLTKCAEAGLDKGRSELLLKKALSLGTKIDLYGTGTGGLAGAGLGALLGAAVSKKKKKRGALIGALLGALGGGTAGYLNTRGASGAARDMDAEVQRGVDIAREAGMHAEKKDIPLPFKEGLRHVFNPGKYKEQYEAALEDVKSGNRFFDRLRNVQNGNINNQWGILGELFGD